MADSTNRPAAQPAVSPAPEGLGGVGGVSRGVRRTLRGLPASDGAGVRLTRVIGQPALPELDPFLMLDEFGSDRPGDYLAGFPDHPHRGFETVTYMLAGRMRHRDSAGNEGLLEAGGVQWMTAGRGLVHSEMPEQQEGLMRGFQLWVNLPAARKMCEPRYQDIAPERIPEVEPATGVRVRVIAGRLGDTVGPVQAPSTEPVYLDLRLAPGARLELALPDGHNAFAYVYEGSARIGDEPGDATAASAGGESSAVSSGAPVGGREVGRGELALLAQQGVLRVAAGASAAQLIVVAGRPLGEPVARYGPFVMNTREQIIEAVEDYQAGRF